MGTFISTLKSVRTFDMTHAPTKSYRCPTHYLSALVAHGVNVKRSMRDDRDAAGGSATRRGVLSVRRS